MKTGGVNCYAHAVEELHLKGILGDGYYLAGSMNFTYNGITINEEAVTYETSAEAIAEQKLIFTNRWGGGGVIWKIPTMHMFATS